MSISESERHPFTEDPSHMPSASEVRGVRQDPIDIPDGKFNSGGMAFNGRVAEEFEKIVIPRQIPGYDEMRKVLLNVALHTAQKGGTFLDLGTSNGRMIRDFALARAQDGFDLGIDRFIGVDIEPDMLRVATDLFIEVEEEVAPRPFKFELMNHDLRRGLPLSVTPESLSIATSIYTIQFIAPEHRLRILTEIYEALKPGAPFIWAEKVLMRSQIIDDAMTAVYYEHKSRSGISDKDIAGKRASLEGNLMPGTHGSNMELLEAAGFKPRRIDTIWRNLQFEAIIAIK